ncbi:MAG: ABC transporter substrate-binding protein, partial [Bacillota bacterium]|nr:ABC transporter substrate-binding protein [Bacillota bacterium]
WELRVCAEPNDPPASNERQEGFENRIAQLLAEELGARLSYVWVPISSQTVRDYLRAGVCDVIMGVPDGFLGLVSTIPYYQIPHVFIYRQDSPFNIQSLEDETLKHLKVGTYPLSLADFALRNLGMSPVLFHPSDLLSQMGVADPLIQALRNRSIDVAILSGPIAAQYSKQYPGEFKVVPVSPEIAPPFIPMFQMGTIAVRPGDESLRDELNLALARRWDAIQGVFKSYGIPLLPLPKPNIAQSKEGERQLRIGVVAPIPTGTPAISDAVGRAAQQGAMVAEDLLGREAASRGVNLQVFLASAPSPEAALRAAERLVAVEGVSALIGGFGTEQAQLLSNLANEKKVLFLNVAAPADALRKTCEPYTFHVEASAAMYLDALANWFSSQGKRRWFFVYPNSDEGESLYRRAIRAISAAGGEEIGKVELPADQRIYTGPIEAIQRARPDVVLSLLAPENQDFFLAQLGESAGKLSIVHFAYPVTQTRTYWRRVRQATSAAEQTYRPVLWEPTLGGAAKEINDQFGSRSGAPMDSSAWAVYASVKLLLDSTYATETTDGSRLAAYLADSKTTFDLFKGVPVSFRPWDHQLRQPLYMVQINPEGEPGVKLSQQLGLARLVGQVPAPNGEDPTSLLDRLGDPRGTTSCSP